MLLKEHDGIRCDQCGTSYREDFVYYSADFHEMVVLNNIMPQFNYKSEPCFFLDICDGCIETVKDNVRQTHKPTKILPGRRCPAGVQCDLSGVTMAGNFTFYHCIIAQVQVMMSGKPTLCIKCNTESVPDEPCPKCGGTTFRKQADTITDERHFELWLSEMIYDRFKLQAIKLRQSTGVEAWTTSGG